MPFLNRMSSIPRIRADFNATVAPTADAVAIYAGYQKAINDGNANYFLISSHGRYELGTSKTPRSADSYSYIVPDNTYIIETLDVGRLCASTIDKPLWNLLQPANRKMLQMLLTRCHPNPQLTDKTPELSQIHNFTNRVIEPSEYLATLRNFIIYLPGMRAPIRTLLFGDDLKLVTEKNASGKNVVRPVYKANYRGFGVYKFPPAEAGKNAVREGAAFPKAKNVVQNKSLSLKNIEIFLYKNDAIFTNMVDAKTTNKIVVEKIDVKNKANPNIIIFSSCGEYYTKDNEFTKDEIESRRTSLMRVIHLQRHAMKQAFYAGFKQFLFRPPMQCILNAENTFMNYMLEKTKPGKENENKTILMNNAYRRTFFPGRENYESEEMYFAQNFKEHDYSYFLTPLELLFFQSGPKGEKDKEFKFMFENLHLYVDFLEHRAEMWYENIVDYIFAQNPKFFSSMKDSIEDKKGFLQAVYDMTQIPERFSTAIASEENRNEFMKSLLLDSQMICWSSQFASILLGVTQDNKEGQKAILQTLLDNLYKQIDSVRKAKKGNAAAAASAAAAAANPGAGSIGGAQRKTHRRQKKLKRTRKSKRT